jgi:hypothetical protein
MEVILTFEHRRVLFLERAMQKISGPNAVPALLSITDSTTQVPLGHRTNFEGYVQFTIAL